jgi:uncharacterized membrane protein
VTPETPPSATRLQRTLAYVIAAVVIASLIAIALVLIGTAAGVTGAGFSHGFWPAVLILPDIGFPIAFVLMIVLLFASMRKRPRPDRSRRR